MARRRSSTRGRKAKQGPGRWAALGVIGAVGLGVVIKARSGDAAEAPNQHLALSAPATGEEAPPPPRAPQAGPRQSQGNAPTHLQAAYTKLNQASLHPLLDLRRLAVEFGDARAARTLEDVAQRALAAARQPNTEPLPALRAMTRAYVATVSAPARRALREEAEAMSAAALGKGGPLFEEYRVQKGDALSRIARRFKTDYRTIKRFSGMKRDMLRIGQRLWIPKSPSEVIIFKGDFELLVVLEGCLVRAFDVATGKNGKTPEGRFTIGTKTVNPTWYSPAGQVYKFGSPENILGTRWLAFENTDEYKGFGIHGTKFPESIGTEASMGCIRMRNAEVEVVFDYVPSGSKVRIVK